MDGLRLSSLRNHPETEDGYFVPKTVPRHFALPLKMMPGIISQFPNSFTRRRKPFQKPIRAAGSSLNQSSLWTSLNGAKGAAPPARRTHEEIAPTLADTPTQVGMEVEGADAPAESNSQTETGDVRMTEAKRSSLQGKAEGETPEKKRANKQKEKSHSSLSEFENFEFCDLGGEGDCAYRSLAVAYALQGLT